jgi:hypothetical protein
LEIGKKFLADVSIDWQTLHAYSQGLSWAVTMRSRGFPSLHPAPKTYEGPDASILLCQFLFYFQKCSAANLTHYETAMTLRPFHPPSFQYNGIFIYHVIKIVHCLSTNAAGLIFRK